MMATLCAKKALKLKLFTIFPHTQKFLTPCEYLIPLNQIILQPSTRNLSISAKPSQKFPSPILLSSSSSSQSRLGALRYQSTAKSSSSDGSSSSNSSNNDNQLPKESIEEFRTRENQREKEYNAEQPKVGTNSSSSSSTTDNDDNNNSEKDEQFKEIRIQILNASLPFVETLGWTREAIAKGAEQQGYPGVAHGMFPNGPIELIHHFYLKCNQQLIIQLREEIKQRNEKNEKKPPTVEFVTNAVRIRLQMMEPYLTHWPQALAIMSLPQNVPTSLAQLLTLVDDICFYAGDRSVDFNWYTRRIGLATIYKMTELYLLQDSSMEHQETWKFLERRIEEGHQIQSVVAISDEKAKNVGKALGTAFSTARNILGLNFERR